MGNVQMNNLIKKIIKHGEICEQIITEFNVHQSINRDKELKSNSRFSVEILEGGIGPGSFLLTLHKFDSKKVILKVAEWISTPEDHNRIKTQLDNIISMNKVSPLVSEVYGYFEAADKYMVIVEYVEAVDPVHPSYKDHQLLIDIGLDSYKSAHKWKEQNSGYSIDTDDTTLVETLDYGIAPYKKDWPKELLGEHYNKVFDFLSKALETLNSQSFKDYYNSSLTFIHRDIHITNIVMSPEGPRLIDFENAGIDNPLIEITRPLIIFIPPEEFPTLLEKAKNNAFKVISDIEKRYFDKMVLMDILACTSYELEYIETCDDPVKVDMAKRIIEQRFGYLKYFCN